MDCPLCGKPMNDGKHSIEWVDEWGFCGWEFNCPNNIEVTEPKLHCRLFGVEVPSGS